MKGARFLRCITANLVKRPPLDGFLRPPTGLLARLGHYGRRYGYVRAVCSFIGRKYFGFWKLVGPELTRTYLRRWAELARAAHP